MSVRVTCPSCGCDFPVEAGLVEGDGKRLAAVMAGMEPLLGRTALQYLHLFKPAKTSLRLARAVKLIAELADLVEPGTVCRDARSGATRPASAALWAAGIEQMLMQRERLELPLANHNYLRAIVYGLADAADAQAERTRHTAARSGQRSGPSPSVTTADPLADQLAYIDKMHAYGKLSDTEWDAERAKAYATYGAKR